MNTFGGVPYIGDATSVLIPSNPKGSRAAARRT
jgi:hypothetical protein